MKSFELTEVIIMYLIMDQGGLSLKRSGVLDLIYFNYNLDKA